MKPADFHELCHLIRLDLRRRRFQESVCSGKHKFASFSQATATISYRLRKVARAYHCPACGGFHIGNVVGQRQNRLWVKERRDRCEFV